MHPDRKGAVISRLPRYTHSMFIPSRFHCQWTRLRITYRTEWSTPTHYSVTSGKLLRAKPFEAQIHKNRNEADRLKLRRPETELRFQSEANDRKEKHEK